MGSLKVLVCVLMGVLTVTSEAVAGDAHREGTMDQRSRLLSQLMDNYDLKVYPDKPNVTFGVSLINLDINEMRSTLETNVWIKMVWYDRRLMWDTMEFPVSLLRMDYSTIWHPDITLYNSADASMSIGGTACWKSNVLVYPSGKVLWVPPCHFSSFCMQTASQYDLQTCFLKFGSWTMDSEIMDLNLYQNVTTIDMSDFWDLSNWKVVSTEAVKNVKFYECCPEPYADLTFKVTFKRKPPKDLVCSV